MNEPPNHALQRLTRDGTTVLLHRSADARERLRFRLTPARQGGCNPRVPACRAVALSEGGWAGSLSSDRFAAFRS
jgi:hypothetical protein